MNLIGYMLFIAGIIQYSYSAVRTRPKELIYALGVTGVVIAAVFAGSYLSGDINSLNQVSYFLPLFGLIMMFFYADLLMPRVDEYVVAYTTMVFCSVILATDTTFFWIPLSALTIVLVMGMVRKKLPKALKTCLYGWHLVMILTIAYQVANENVLILFRPVITWIQVPLFYLAGLFWMFIIVHVTPLLGLIPRKDQSLKEYWKVIGFFSERFSFQHPSFRVIVLAIILAGILVGNHRLDVIDPLILANILVLIIPLASEKR